MRFVYHSGGPGSFIAFFLFVALLFLLFVVLPANIAAHAAEGLGLTPLQGIVLLVAMVLTRGLEFTVYRSERLVREVIRPETPFAELLRMRGMAGAESIYGEELVPQTFAVALGGLILPLVMSAVFLFRVAHLPNALAWAGLAVVVSSAVCFAATTYRGGMPPKLPVFLPPVCAGLTAVMLPHAEFTAAASFAAAVFGPIVGNGFLPLAVPRMRGRVDTPYLVFGGPQVFWGIFFGCVVAGLVA